VRWSSPALDNDIVNVKRTINTTTEFNLRQHRDISLSAGVMVSLTATLIIASSQEFVSQPMSQWTRSKTQRYAESARNTSDAAHARYSQQQLRACVTDSIPCYWVLCLETHITDCTSSVWSSCRLFLSLSPCVFTPE